MQYCIFIMIWEKLAWLLSHFFFPFYLVVLTILFSGIDENDELLETYFFFPFLYCMYVSFKTMHSGAIFPAALIMALGIYFYVHVLKNKLRLWSLYFGVIYIYYYFGMCSLEPYINYYFWVNNLEFLLVHKHLSTSTIIKYGKSEEQLADTFTRALPKSRFEKLKEQLNLKE